MTPPPVVPLARPAAPPWPALLAGWAGGAAAALLLAQALGPLRALHAASWLVVGLVAVPLLMAAALAAAVAALVAIAALLAAPSRLAGRPTGLAELARSLWQLPAAVLPGYWRALRRVRRPALWGAVLGAWCGTGLAIAWTGLAPAA